MQQQPVFISKETLKALADSADAVDFGRTIDTSGGGYMDSAEASARVVATNRTFRKLRPRPERVTFSFGEAVAAATEPATAPQETPAPKKRRTLVPASATTPKLPPSVTTSTPKIIRPPSRSEIERRNKQIQKAAEGLVSYSDVITASAASGENSRQRLKTLKTIFGGKQTGKDGTILTSSSAAAKTSSIKAIDSSLEAASSITRRARKSAAASRKRRNPSAPAAAAASNAAILNTRAIVTTLLKEALSRFVGEDLVPEEQAASWVRKYSRNRMIYTMNMRFFAAALVWIYTSFGNKEIEATMKVDEEFGRQVSSSTLKKKIDELIQIAKPVLTEALSSLGTGGAADSQTSSSSINDLDRSVLFTYAVWIIYNENEAYSIDYVPYEEEEEGMMEEGDEGEGEGEEGEYE